MDTLERTTTRLSVNINKVALIRNARGGNLPDLVQVARDCEAFGAEGITVHPRPDERHIRFSDIPLLREVVQTELNVEGNPTNEFMKLVLAHSPHQCTLVPDAPDSLTSNGGWDTIAHQSFLKEIIGRLHERGIRVSIFIDPQPEYVVGAFEAGADRVELYTGEYARDYEKNKAMAIENHKACAFEAWQLDVGLNAGHDLNLQNLTYYNEQIPTLAEVSIGHALLSDSLYFGLLNTIHMYKRCLLKKNIS